MQRFRSVLMVIAALAWATAAGAQPQSQRIQVSFAQGELTADRVSFYLSTGYFVCQGKVDVTVRQEGMISHITADEMVLFLKKQAAAGERAPGELDLRGQSIDSIQATGNVTYDIITESAQTKEKYQAVGTTHELKYFHEQRIIVFEAQPAVPNKVKITVEIPPTPENGNQPVRYILVDMSAREYLRFYLGDEAPAGIERPTAPGA